LGGVLSTSSTAIINETSADVVGLLDAHRALLEHSLRDRLLDMPITASGAALERYLVATLGDARSERMRALYLDGGNRLIRDELIAEGDPGSIPVSTRKVLNRALELCASAVILVHNHPGGSAEPSSADIAFTRRVADAGKHLAIRLHDHLIIAGNACVSLRERGLLQ
jgi:DNA repair protein RadC